MTVKRYSVATSVVLNDGDTKVLPANAKRVRIHVSTALPDPANQLLLAVFVDDSENPANLLQSVNNFGSGAIIFDYRDYGDLVQRRIVISADFEADNISLAVIETIEDVFPE